MRQLAIAAFALVACQSALAAPPCVPFTVVTRDTLNNVKQGVEDKDLKWVAEIGKKYPVLCYVAPSPTVPLVFYIRVTTDVYHGSKVVTSTSRSPVDGTVTDQDGNTARVEGDVTTTNSTAVPYSRDYYVYTLSIERRTTDGKFAVLHNFQQKGIYMAWYGIPLGGKGHHPIHAVIEDAAKWVTKGGLTDPTQNVLTSQPQKP